MVFGRHLTAQAYPQSALQTPKSSLVLVGRGAGETCTLSKQTWLAILGHDIIEWAREPSARPLRNPTVGEWVANSGRCSTVILDSQA